MSSIIVRVISLVVVVVVVPLRGMTRGWQEQ